MAAIPITRRQILLAGACATLVARHELALSTMSPSLSRGMYQANDYGVLPDDDKASALLVKLLDLVPPGSIIYFPPGDYDLSRWKGFELRKHVTLVATKGSVNLYGPGTDDKVANRFLTIRECGKKNVVITFEGLSFTTWSRTIFIDNRGGPVSGLFVRQCEFNNVFRAIHADGGGGKSETSSRSIERVVIEDSHFTNVLDAALGIFCRFESATVRGNYFDTLGGSAIMLGNTNSGTGRKDTNWRKSFVSQNVCKNLIVHKKDYDIHAIIAAGREVIISDNHIERVSNGGGQGAEGIYTKASYSIIRSNTLLNAGSREAAITLKGMERNRFPVRNSYGHSNQIVGNTILFTNGENCRGIMSFTSDVMITGNYIEGAEGGIRASGEDGYILVSGNLLKNIAHHGIKVDTAGESVVVDGNMIHLAGPGRSVQQGVWLVTRGQISSWRVSGNTIVSDARRKSRGVYLVGVKSEIHGLRIADNDFSHLAYAIFAKRNEAPVFRKGGLWIKDNRFHNCDVGLTALFKLAEQEDGVVQSDNLITKTKLGRRPTASNLPEHLR